MFPAFFSPSDSFQACSGAWAVSHPLQVPRAGVPWGKNPPPAAAPPLCRAQEPRAGASPAWREFIPTKSKPTFSHGSHQEAALRFLSSGMGDTLCEVFSSIGTSVLKHQYFIKCNTWEPTVPPVSEKLPWELLQDTKNYGKKHKDISITPHCIQGKGSLLHLSAPALIKQKLVCLITVQKEGCGIQQWIICQWLEGQWVNSGTTQWPHLGGVLSVTGESPSFVPAMSPWSLIKTRAGTYQSRGRQSQVTAESIGRACNSHTGIEILQENKSCFPSM